MTETEAKELLIDGMNYAAYRETDHSLFTSDKNKLFGSQHYEQNLDQTVPGSSPWGEGDEFDKRMAELLRWAVQLGTTRGDYTQAIRTLRNGDHYLSRVIARAGLTHV